MQIERIQEMGNSYMKISGVSLFENSSGFQMLRFNQVTGILTPVSRFIDGEESYYFEINNYLSLEQYIQKNNFGKKELKELIFQIEKVYEMAKEYLIEEHEIILKRESVCIDTNGMVFLPFLSREMEIDEQGENKGILSVVETVMIYMDHANKQLIFFVYELYKYCKEEEICIYDLKKLLIQIEENMQERERNGIKEPVIEIKRSEIKQIESMNSPIKKSESIEKEFMEKRIIEKSHITFGGLFILGVAVIAGGLQSRLLRYEISGQYDRVKVLTFIVCILLLEIYAWVKLGKQSKEQNKIIETPKEEFHVASDETVLLRSEVISKKIMLKSIDQMTKDIFIAKFPFIIGKMDSRVDGVIEHEGVSRIHGEFSTEEENILFCDLGSTNGTYLNNEELISHQAINIHIGDILQFGIVAYQVDLCE